MRSLILISILLTSFVLFSPSVSTTSNDKIEGSVSIQGEKVSMNFSSNYLSVKSNDISLEYYNDSISVDFKKFNVNMEDTMSIYDVYNLSEKQENLYAPGEDPKDEVIVKSKD